MNLPSEVRTTTPPVINWIGHPPQRGFFIILLTFAWFALSQTASAQDGDYGNGNTAEGLDALHTYITTGTSGSANTAIGTYALLSNTSGGGNTATGDYALYHNATANNNTATGFSALSSNNSLDSSNTANDNTADGFEALLNNTTGFSNTAIGSSALATSYTHSYNTATGFEALKVADADDNTATGALALHSDSSGYYNTATGVSSLFSNTTGYYNVSSGVSALYYNVGGHDNAAVGFQALVKNKGSNNIGLGSNAGANLTTGNNNIDIGAPGVAAEANTIRIGKSGTQQKTFLAGIYGKTVASGVGVIVNSNGQLGTVQSSARFKDDIKPMEKASEALLKLNPVTFRYKKELDPDKVPQFGLVAEEVEKINPDLVVRDEEGKVMSVRYEAVNAMLLNEFLKEHRRAEEQRKYFEAKFAQQQKQIDTLTATVQKVRAQPEVSKSSAQVVGNNQ